MIIKKYIPNRIKEIVKYIFSDKKIYNGVYSKNEKKIIIAVAANYGNLGDVAITYAQNIFLKENFNDYKIIEIPIDKTYVNMRALKSIVNQNDIITIIGGGNFGNRYWSIEQARQFFIRSFPKNKIICFPQTIDFSDDEEGINKIKKTQRLYRKHKNLVLFAREEKSYEKMKKLFYDNKVFLVPDIVLSLNREKPIMERKYITLCFRNDLENKINQDEKNTIIKSLKEIYKENIIEKDTHVGNIKIEKEQREKYLEEIWTAFRESKIVLTDRLHGMIFCAITKTPCIAFPNANGKIESTYNTWLKNNPYIFVYSEKFNKEEVIAKVKELSNNNFNNYKENFRKEFEKLKKQF